MSHHTIKTEWMTHSLKRAIAPEYGSSPAARRVQSKTMLRQLLHAPSSPEDYEVFWPIAASSDETLRERTKAGVFQLTHVIGEVLGEHSVLLEFVEGKSPNCEHITLLCSQTDAAACDIQLTRFDALTYQTALAPDDPRAEILQNATTRITIRCN